MKYVTNTISLIVRPEGEPIFHESATVVAIDDNAAGPFVTIRQQFDSLKPGEIAVDRESWPAIREAVDRQIDECYKIECDTDK